MNYLCLWGDFYDGTDGIAGFPEGCRRTELLAGCHEAPPNSAGRQPGRSPAGGKRRRAALRSGHEDVNQALEENLSHRLEIAGIHVIEARIGHLAYAPEIAGAMLRRQQATAVVAARFKIVEGAVSMVQMALDHLSKQQIIELDEERKAAMVSNLMVVLCSDKDVAPVVNAGTLNP